jgi:hypothetical protein
MIRERVLTLSTLLALVALSGAAYAGPRITDETSTHSTYRQAAPDWYSARAMQPSAAPAQIVPAGASVRYGCRHSYQGGPGGGPKSTAWC